MSIPTWIFLVSIIVLLYTAVRYIIKYLQPSNRLTPGKDWDPHYQYQNKETCDKAPLPTEDDTYTIPDRTSYRYE